MKTFAKKTLSIITAAILIVTSFAFFGGSFNSNGIIQNADAADVFTDGSYKYTVTDGKAEIVGTVGKPSGNVVLPDTLSWYPVTSIGESAFFWCDNLASVTIPSSVENINSNAFDDCKSLTSIKVADGNTNFSSEGGVLFNKDKTELIKFPEGKTGDYSIPSQVTSIGENAFNSCLGLTSVTIPDSVTDIGSSAFYNCTGIKSIKIPASVTKIGECAFLSCSKSIETAHDNPNYSSADGILFNKDKSELIQFPMGKSGKYQIPSTIVTIRAFAFNNATDLEFVLIPDSVEKIESHAFDNCKGLKSVTIPDSVTSIGGWAFAYCDALTSVTIGSSVSSIGKGAFSGCTALKTVSIPVSVTDIENSAFYSCNSLKDVNYSGYHTDWEKISIGSNNDSLNKASIHCKEVVKPTEPSTEPITEPNTEEQPSKEPETKFDLGNAKGEIVKSYDGTKQIAVIYSATDVKTLLTKIGHSSYTVTDAAGNEKSDDDSVYSGDRINTGKNAYITAILGDVNLDGKVNSSDARLVLRLSAKLESFSDVQLEAAKVLKSNEISALNARQILRYSAKLDNKFEREG